MQSQGFFVTTSIMNPNPEEAHEGSKPDSNSQQRYLKDSMPGRL
jgi:hypothetical protein